MADVDNVEMSEKGEGEDAAKTAPPRMARPRARLLTALVLPGLCLPMALGVGYLKWRSDTEQQAKVAATQSVVAATEGVTSMLSYRFGSVDKDLKSATDKMTGRMRQDYTKLITEIVIPGAVQKRISSEAKIPAAASLSATPDHAEVLLYINQLITFGNEQPTLTTSSARVSLQKVNDQWLMSDFQQVP